MQRELRRYSVFAAAVFPVANKVRSHIMNFPSLDQWQYRLSRRRGQKGVAVGDMWLETDAELPVTRLTDIHGTAVGVLIGFPIDLKARRIIDGDWQVPAQLDEDADAFVREGFLALGGRFLWIYCAQGVARIYPDCSAQIPCVFDPRLQVVGSTAHALLDDSEYDARFNKALFDELGVDGEGWFPAGLTAHHGLSRLLPNHYLDLDTWTIERFWSGPEAQTGDPSKIVAEIIEIIQAQIEAMVNGSKRVAMALTAGHETRMLLACARPFLEQVDFFTVIGGDRHETDTVIARRIADTLGLSYLTVTRTVSDPQQRALFIRRGGHCNADTNSHFHPSVWPISKSHVMVGGLGGEIARAFLWRDTDTPQMTLTPALLTARFGLTANEGLVERLDQWLNVLQDANSLHILDLAYHEHRNGAWYAVQFCSDPTLLRQAPLLTLRTVELMMQLPADWKRADRLGHEIITHLWPELERLPYNSLGVFRDTFLKLRKVVADPRTVMKKMRKLRG